MSILQSRRANIFVSDAGLFVDQNGTPVVVSNSVATWADLQAIPKISAYNDLIVLVTGIGPNGALFRYNHSITMWVNLHPFMLYDVVFGAKGAGTLQVSSNGASARTFAPATTPTIPAGMLRAGSTLEIEAQVGRVSGVAGASSIIIYLGTSATSTANSAIAGATLAATAAHVSNLNPMLSFSSTTKLTSTYSVNPNSGSSSASIQDFTTNIDTASAMQAYVVANISTTGDVFELLRLAVKVNTI